jgi:hypothetical protein
MESMVEWGMGVAVVARFGPGIKPCAADILKKNGPGKLPDLRE